MNNNSNNPKDRILHGNGARIDPRKHVIPQFQNCVTDVNYGMFNDSRYKRAYHRLDDDDSEFWKDIVDSNPL